MNWMVVVGWFCYTVLVILQKKILQLAWLYTKYVQVGPEMINFKCKIWI